MACWPPASSRASSAAAFSAAQPSDTASVPPPALAFSAGISTSNGTTARSWNSSTPITRLPCSLSSSSRSAMSLTTMAVLDMAMAEPSTTAPCQPSCQGRPSKRKHLLQDQVAEHRTQDRERHLHQPQAEHDVPHAAQLGQVELKPDHEHQEHHAKLGQVAHGGGVGGQRQRVGADQHAHHQVAQHGWQFQRAARHHAQHGGHEVKQDELKSGSHAVREWGPGLGHA